MMRFDVKTKSPLEGWAACELAAGGRKGRWREGTVPVGLTVPNDGQESLELGGLLKGEGCMKGREKHG